MMKITNYKLQITNKKAFTLIELIVSMTVFAIFLGVIISSFLSFMRTYVENNNKRKVYIEARQVLDSMVQEFRLGRIDYNCYKKEHLDATSKCYDIESIDSNGVTKSLALLKNDGLSRIFFDNDVANEQIKTFKQKRDSIDKEWKNDDEYGTEWIPLLSDRVKLARLKFKIWPKEDPYTTLSSDPSDPEGTLAIINDSSNQYQFQPKVTIFLTLKTRSRLGPDEYDSIELQTTVSSRFYNKL